MSCLQASIAWVARRWTPVVILIVLNQSPLLPQHRPLEFEHFSVEQGLSHSSVYAIAQDTKGFLWFGTRNGLNRFDGYTFKVYQHDPLDSTSLSESEITSLTVDSRDNLWVGTSNGGLNRYRRESDSFVRYRYDPNNPRSIYGQSIGPIVEDKTGSLWVAAFGVYLYDRSTDSFGWHVRDSSNGNGLSCNEVDFIHLDYNSNLWIGTRCGLDQLDSARKRVRHFKHDPENSNSLSHNNILTGLGLGNILWLGTDEGGLNKFEIIREHFTQYRFNQDDPQSLGNDAVSAISVDHEGNLWIGTYQKGGLNIFDPRKRGRPIFERYRRTANDKTSLSENRIRSLFEDRSGNFWIGTDNGLNKVSHSKKFSHSLRGQLIGNIYRNSRGEIWIATSDSGVVVMNEEKLILRSYRHNPADPHSLSANFGYRFYEDESGDMWVGTFQGGLNKFDRTRNRFVRYTLSSNPYENSVVSISGIRNRKMLVCTEGGTVMFDIRTNKSTPRKDLKRILEDGTGALWSIEGDVFTEVTPDGKRGLHLAYDESSPAGFRVEPLVFVKQDVKGILWILTNENGLVRWDLQSRTFKRYTTNNGLANNSLYGLLFDKKGILWIGTENGLSRFDSRTETFRNYYADDGLPTNNFYWSEPCITKRGEMLFGTTNGLVGFFPDDIRPNMEPPPVVLTSFKTLHKEFKFDRDISDVKEIEITYRENVFSFEVASLDFTNPQRNEYSYKMEGFDKDWTYAGTRRYFTYTNLNPGTYTFRVKGSNSDGVWNEVGASVRLTITPPFWFTWWFMTLAGGMAFAGIVYAYRWRVNNLLQIERTRDRIARDLHDDIASTLGSIALYSASLRRKLPKMSRETDDLIKKIGTLSLDAIDAMGDIVWSVEPKHDTLQGTLTHLRDLASQLFTAFGIEYEINIPSDTNHVELLPELRKGVFLIAKEALNNIVKHSHATKATVTARIHEGTLEIRIHDNGKGFTRLSPAVSIERGHGLRNMEGRAKEIDGFLTVESKPGLGTTILLRKRMT